MRGNAWIEVCGARTHNLQNVQVRIPQQALTVLTGVSGSGKSSLAFHTLFAEGQRRYLKSLAGHAREWLNLLPRPEVDSITGLPPVISVSQERSSPRQRSTVATITEMLDYLRVLYARLGVVYCPACQIPVEAQNPEQIVQQILQFPPGTKLMLLAPIVRQQAGTQQQVLQKVSKEGYVRARIDGEIVDLSELPVLAAEKLHHIEVVIDRLIIKDDIQSRLAESVDQTLRMGQGSCLLVVQEEGEWRDRLFHQELCCPGCQTSYAPLESTSFSWSAPQGACPTCTGTGIIQEDEKNSDRQSDGDTLSDGRATNICPACQGERLNVQSANVRLRGQRLPEILAWPLLETSAWLKEQPAEFKTSDQQTLWQKLTEPLLYRLDFLAAVGVGYLSLNREAVTLSGGELQRVRLARCLGTQLQGSCYILDEPTVGLHAEDTDRLIKILRQMTAAGNTVLCVEHNILVIQAADYLVELGPHGGREGGQILFQGSPATLQSQQTATAQALQQAEEMERSAAQAQSERKRPETLGSKRGLHHQQVSLHNLQSLDYDLPWEKITCVTGVSGSGKSTLILDSLAPLLQESLRSQQLQIEGKEQGLLQLDRPLTGLQVVDQSPPGKNVRSCPATYSGMWDDVRRVLAQTRLAKIRGYSSQRFSINGQSGICTECRGRGEVMLKVEFLAENRVICPVCRGKRFNPATLAIKYNGRSCADLLEMTIEEALKFWGNIQSIQQKLLPFQAIGLGYLCLGQSMKSVSGGEAQRMKLARRMSEPQAGDVLILDEPTSGLHWADVSRLIHVLQALVKQGSTVIVIEHHPLMQAAADWQLTLGPEAGPLGGQLLFCGPP